MTKNEALRLALEWIRSAPHSDNCFLHEDGEYNRCFCGKDSLENFIDEVLAQPEPEPVAWLSKGKKGIWFHEPDASLSAIPLYTTPPKREPLTDEWIERFWLDHPTPIKFARAIEAAHGIK